MIKLLTENFPVILSYVVICDPEGDKEISCQKLER